MQGRQPNPVFSDEYQLLREILVEARQAAGVSQRGLGARIGKTASHVCMIETGQRRIDTLEFYKVARSVGVEPVALFERLSALLDGLAKAEAEQA